MAEPSLALSLADLESEVGFFLGYGRGTAGGGTAWTTRQEQAITSCVASGLRQFYFPPPVDGPGVYDWSFLKPTASLGLASGASSANLPDDFGGFEGEITLHTDANSSWPVAVPLVNEGLVRLKYASFPATTGTPRLAALEPFKGTAVDRGQRWKLNIWPLADQAYTLSFQYYIEPDYLTAGHPYPYGGSQHAETLLESCLAVAEQRLDDAATIHAMRFRERLAASIASDRRRKPQLIGYNGDRSDMVNQRGGNWWHYEGVVTYNGVQY